MNDERTLTYGEKAVGLTFNPSGDGDVTYVKEHFAALIDFFHAARGETDNQEQKRLYSIAITEAQTAQMWGVKSVTWRG